jgi:tetratricopeptide (TPR) repeat protein
LLHKIGRDADALVHIDAALEVNPEHAELYSRRAELKKDLHRYDEAIKDIDNYLRLSSQPFDHPDIQHAWRLRTECEEELRTARAAH